jgi:hypothetical protein
MEFAAILRLVGNGLIRMAKRAFEEETGLYHRTGSVRAEMDRADERSLEGLPAPRVILLETGQALAAALAVGVFLCALLQWTGVR